MKDASTNEGKKDRNWRMRCPREKLQILKYQPEFYLMPLSKCVKSPNTRNINSMTECALSLRFDIYFFLML